MSSLAWVNMFSTVWLRWAAFVFCWVVFFGVPAVGAEQKADLNAAREAVHDELYDLAARRLESLIPAAATGTNDRIEAVLLLADVYKAQNRFEEMAGLLLRHEAEIAASPRVAAWMAARAEADAGTGRVAAALRQISELEQRFPDSPELARACRLRGWCLARLGRLEEALVAFKAYDAQVRSGPDADANRLEWVKALLGAGRLDDAAALLKKNGVWPDKGPLAESRRLALAELAAARRDDSGASELLSGLVESRDAHESDRAAALFLLAEIQERQTNSAAALDTLKQAGRRLTDPAFKNETGLHEGMLLLRLGRIDEGMPLIRAFVSVNSTNDAARGVQLALARALLDRGLFEQAASEYQHYLEAFSDTSGMIQAFRGRGWSLFQIKRYGEALDAFRKGRSLATAPVDREWFQVKIADSHFANVQYQQAREAFQQAITEFSKSAQLDLYRFQSAECRARLGEDSAAQAEFMELAETAADPVFRARAMLRAAELIVRQGRLLEALNAYQRLLDQAPPDSARAEARHGMGLIQYRLGRFEEALKNFERVSSDAVGHESAEQGWIMIAWCRHMMGESDKALAAFKVFKERYPDSAFLPDVLFWMGEFEYNLGMYHSAEAWFTELAKRFSDLPLADAALFWAGRAAFMQKEFRRANSHASNLLRLWPKSPRRAEARYYQAEAMCELGDFPAAILLYDEIIKQFPGSRLLDQSWCRKGDCLYTLGSEDPKRYEEAMSAYQAVLGRTEAAAELSLRAEYGIGRCLDKLGRHEKAFERYMNVVYKYLENRERNTQDCDIWFTRAAFNAAEMKEAEKSWRAAVNLYQRVVDAQVAAAPDAQHRIQKIRMEQWIFFY